jgi:hypothetical protein
VKQRKREIGRTRELERPRERETAERERVNQRGRTERGKPTEERTQNRNPSNPTDPEEPELKPDSPAKPRPDPPWVIAGDGPSSDFRRFWPEIQRLPVAIFRWFFLSFKQKFAR